jgi:flavin-dependent dehydrogenase
MQVAVVGAGPAGAFCAERLARSGHAVALWDPSHPREKPCGGGVTPGVFERHPELRSLRGAGRPATRTRLRTPSGHVLEVGLEQPVDIFARRTLDGLMLERACAAGAKHVAERVRRARVDDDGVCIETDSGTRRFDFVVGADGASSVVRRSLLGETPGGAGSWAAGGFFVEALAEEELYVEFLRDVQGYLWTFPRPDHCSVGVVVPIGFESGARIRARVRAMLERRYPGSAPLRATPYGMSIPSPTPRQARDPALGGPRFALIGDAGNLVDAITGEGIQHAIDSAAMLARALDDAGPLDAHRLYRERWMAGPGRELARAAVWAAWLYRPWLVSPLLGLARHSARARRIVADLLMMRQPYTTLFGRVARDALFGASSAGDA